MVASFTRGAASEVAGRDLPISHRQVGTLHSFAYRSLDTPELVVKHTRDFNGAHPGYALSIDHSAVDVDDPNYEASASTTEGDRLMQRMEVLRAQRTPEAAWPASVLGFARAWQGWKREAGYLDFTDLIALAAEATTHAPGDPTVGCFDEVQDFTPLELSLVRHWGKRMAHVLLAGDDDQCIYGFKGATPDAFLDPPIPNAQKRVLSQSYRVPRAVHRAAQAWVERLARREVKVYEPRDEDGSVRGMPGANFRSPERVVADELRVADEGGTAMILATCAYMLDPAKAILKRDGIPFHNPYRRKRGDWNPLAPGSATRRTASDRVLAFMRLNGLVWGDDTRVWTGAELIAWTQVLKADGVFVRGAKKQIEAWRGKQRVDLDDLAALLNPEAVDAHLTAMYSGDLDWFAGHLLASKAKPFMFPLRVAARRGAATLRERPRIILGTIHSVKGGEADAVYLFPDLSTPGAHAWQSGQHDEIVRQMYVGMTRARRDLVVCGQASPLAVDPNALLAGAQR